MIFLQIHKKLLLGSQLNRLSIYILLKTLMKKSIFKLLFLSIWIIPFSAFAQLDVTEKFNPLPKRIQKITGTQYTIYEGDTTSEVFSEYNFDEKGNITRWEHFPYYIKEELKYDSLDRIIEIDGLYGESFGNGIIKYEYPSKNLKIEIHDKMSFYKYIKSNLTFDSMNRISTEIKYDSTFNLMDSTILVAKMNITYLYDKNGNLIEESYSTKDNDEIIYTHKTTQIYDNGKLASRNTHYYKKNSSDDYYTDEVKDFFYVKEGKFKDKIEKEIELITSKNDTVKLEIRYTYQELDSITISQERKQSYHKGLQYFQKNFYKNGHLIKIEEYKAPKDSEENKEPKLEMWTEYNYFFYKK